MSKNNDIKVTYLSDAHLFSGGLNVAYTIATLDRIQDAMEHSQLVVLNGDIFELPFSGLGFSRSVARAISTLEYMLKAYPKVEVNYVVGNHDGDTVFIHELQQLANRYENFRVSQKHFLIEGILAGHGDLIDKGQTKRKTEFYPQFSWHKFVGGLQIEAQRLIHGWNSKIYQPDKWAHKTDQYFEKHEADLYCDVDEFITGHTHVPMDKLLYRGKEHSNSGAVFEEAIYKPVRRTISRASFEEYKKQKKAEKPLELKSDGEARAHERIKGYRAEAQEPLAVLQGDAGTAKGRTNFTERILEISKTHSKGKGR